MVSKAAERSRSTRAVYVDQLQEEGRYESKEGQFLWNGILCRQIGMRRKQEWTVDEL